MLVPRANAQHFRAAICSGRRRRRRDLRHTFTVAGGYLLQQFVFSSEQEMLATFHGVDIKSQVDRSLV